MHAVPHVDPISAFIKTGWLEIISNRVVKLTEQQKKRYWTVSAIKDRFTLELSSAADYNINPNTGHIEIYQKYFKYAAKTMYLTSLARDIKNIPIFEIKKSDLSHELVTELEEQDKKTLNEIIIDGISNLYESINFKFFHINAIRGKIRWVIV